MCVFYLGLDDADDVDDGEACDGDATRGDRVRAWCERGQRVFVFAVDVVASSGVDVDVDVEGEGKRERRGGRRGAARSRRTRR